MKQIESNFVKSIIEDDLKEGRVKEIVTRFPPEPNAYMHIGHARAIVTNFELAKEFGGKTNLRFDDTNPVKEDTEFVEGIIEDIKWFGYTPDGIYYGSDYFSLQYDLAVKLIKDGKAYVCNLSPEQINEYRGTFEKPGVNSPYRDRSVEENLKLFSDMKNRKFKEGEAVLRAKIDMTHENINMRDPVLYRISYANHHRQKDNWVIYPMYDFAHPLQDAFEGITHSLCSLEFANHRILYDWVIDNTGIVKKPHQYEFGRLNIQNTVTSKRYLRLLVEKGMVNGYDDPRLPSLRGLRRRGVTPNAIRNFILDTGLSRTNATVSEEMFYSEVRDDLKLSSKRTMAVIDPLKVTIENYPEDKVEYFEVLNNQENESLGTHKISFSKHLYIEKDDFLEVKPNNKYKRLSLGDEVRLMNTYFIKASKVIKDKKGNVVEVICTYDPLTKSESGFNERKPNGTISFVDEKTALPARFNLINELFLGEVTNQEEVLEKFNKNSLVVKNGFVSMGTYLKEEHYQIIRDGYYIVDSIEPLTFNRTVSLKANKVSNEFK